MSKYIKLKWHCTCYSGGGRVKDTEFYLPNYGEWTVYTYDDGSQTLRCKGTQELPLKLDNQEIVNKLKDELKALQNLISQYEKEI